MKLRKLQKPNKKQVKRFLFHSFLIICGNALASAAAAFFIAPNDFVMGGTTGIGLFVKGLLGEDNYEWVVSLTVYIANISLFILGAFLLGKKFAAATLAGTLLYPSFLALFTYLNGLYIKSTGTAIAADNPLLAAICGALCFGFGIGIVVRIGASTGGTDIPPLILHKYFNLPLSIGMWCTDLLVVALPLFAGFPIEMVLYGIIITLLSGFVVNAISFIGRKRAQVMIVSKKYKEIREVILDKMNRGATMLYGKTGFLQERTFVLITVVSNRDLVKLKNEVQAVDPDAFMMISVISEVRGRGFSSDKIALPKEDGMTDLVVVDDIDEDKKERRSDKEE